MNKTTIVISNYNYGQYLECAIKSAVKQTSKCDIIVVDDASKDNSWQLIQTAVAKYRGRIPFTGVRLKKNSNGNARGKNVGICLSKTPYITCLDSDDMLTRCSVSLRERKLESSQADWVHAKALFMESETTDYDKLMRILYRRPRRAKSKPLEIGPYAMRLLNMTPGMEVRKNEFKYDKFIKLNNEADLAWYKGVEASTVLVRREAYEKVGLYDEILKWKIDREMWHRFLSNGIKKRFINATVSVYRKHSKQATRNRSIKNPQKVNKQFDIQIEARKKMDPNNTLFIDHYDPYEYIAEVLGDLA